MDTTKLKRLLIAYKEGSISQKEAELLKAYVSSTAEDDTETLRSVLLELMYEQDEDLTIPVLSDELYHNIISDVRFRKKRTVRLYMRMGSVAAVVLLLLSGIWFWSSDFSGSDVGKRTERIRMVTSTPTERLLLRASDGTTYDIDKLVTGRSIGSKQDLFSIEDNEITYASNSPSHTVDHTIHTLVTPKGRQFKVVLSDGTNVWLNAATTLKFPVHFAQDERVVEVDGEAYFEVQKSTKRPFIVHSSGQKIKVLGTHFNVHSYKEDNKSSTTLIEGKVEVSSSGQQRVLLPGEQAISSNQHNELLVQSVNAQDVIAWKDRLFVFHNEEIQDVMRQVSRWYDVEVEYLDGMEGKHIAGSIPRYENIGKLMAALAATDLLNYEIKGGTVIISK